MIFDKLFPKKQPTPAPAGGAAGMNPYRLLGVGESSTYEEVEAAYAALVKVAAGNPKQKVKLEIAKEKIYEDRLQKRISGELEGTVKYSPFEARKRREKKVPFTKAAMAKVGVSWVRPEPSHVTKVLWMFAIPFFVALATPHFAASGLAIGFVLAFYNIYHRGAPDRRGDEYGGGSSRAVGPPEYGVFWRSVGVSVVCAVLGSVAAQLGLLVLPAVANLVAVESFVTLMIVVGLAVATMFFQVREVKA